MNLNYRPNSSQRGNILFIILLAVVLFAALNYAVTQSMRGDGKSSDQERADSYAAEIMNYGALLANTATRLILTNDCREYQVSGYTNAYSAQYPGNYLTTGSGGPQKCRIFDPLGGNVTLKRFDKNMFISAPLNGDANLINTTGNMCFPRLGNFTGTPAGNRIFVLMYLTKSVCSAINKKVFGNANWADTNKSTVSGGGFAQCVHGYEMSQWSSFGTNYSSNVNYNAQGCAQMLSYSENGGYVYWHVITSK